METEGLIKSGWVVGFVIAAKTEWLEARDTDTLGMDEETIKQHESGSSVFILISCKLLDTMEDIIIRINL